MSAGWVRRQFLALLGMPAVTACGTISDDEWEQRHADRAISFVRGQLFAAHRYGKTPEYAYVTSTQYPAILKWLPEFAVRDGEYRKLVVDGVQLVVEA